MSPEMNPLRLEQVHSGLGEAAATFLGMAEGPSRSPDRLTEGG